MARKRRRKTSHVKYDSQQDELIRSALENPITDEEIAAADEYIAMMAAKLKENPLYPSGARRPAFPRSTQGCRVVQSPDWWDNLGDAADV